MMRFPQRVPGSHREEPSPAGIIFGAGKIKDFTAT
jgi:hypothetical protein